MVYLFQNEISVQHMILNTSKNCQTQSTLSGVEINVEEIKNYYDGNEILD